MDRPATSDLQHNHTDASTGTISFRWWFLIGLFDLLAAGTIGVLLRAIYITEIPFVRFRPWLHGHSHTAMLGWLFIGVVIALLHDGGSRTIDRTENRLLIGIQLAVLGMLVAFPIQGYGAVSITASTVHMLLAYVLMAILWKASKPWPQRGSRSLVRWAIGFFVLSTLGIWSTGPIIAAGMQGKEIYYWMVQFFLHFQFNGWFWFAAMALGVRWAERQGIALVLDRFTLGLWVASATLTYALAIAWSEPHPAVFATVSVGVILQLWAAWRTLGVLRNVHKQAHGRIPVWGRWLVGIALVSMALKVLVQGAVSIPAVATMAFTIRHYVMGFIHMNTLGTMTMLLLAYAVMHGWCQAKAPIARWGIRFMITGIIATELLLFCQGTFFWFGWGMISGHYWHLFIASILIPTGVALILIQGVFDRSSRIEAGPAVLDAGS